MDQETDRLMGVRNERTEFRPEGAALRHLERAESKDSKDIWPGCLADACLGTCLCSHI